VVARVDEVRPHLEGGHDKPPCPRRRKDPQGDGGLAAAAASRSDDETFDGNLREKGRELLVPSSGYRGRRSRLSNPGIEVRPYRFLREDFAPFSMASEKPTWLRHRRPLVSNLRPRKPTA
jgi:hypothetical protein